ncbi:MAG: hypothetical protein MJA83_07350 [Gammaproteobacteria bacterium]|nr:hypothetical protein [Gammaproteobacteria bacterium]
MKAAMKNSTKTLLAFVVTMFTASAVAAIELETVVQKEEQYVENGEQKVRLVAAETVVPGEEVVYTIYFTNTGDQPAENVVVTDPIPEHTYYKVDSAFGAGTDIVFSADGGRTYGSPDALTVLGEDGQSRSAGPRDYTHIRWTLRNDLPSGQRGFVRFRAVLE